MPRDLPLPGGLELRPDLRLIADMVAPATRVLDVGCGDGALLSHLWREKRVDARGIEISPAGVSVALSRGLSVIQGDADTDLADYPDVAFDYVVLSQTLQAMKDPKATLGHLVRIGRHALVSFPNFGYWRVRFALLHGGRMPVTKGLPDQWWETPNIHHCTIADFVALCDAMGIRIERAMVVHRSGKAVPMAPGDWANWIGETGVFLLQRA
ncbi:MULTISPECIES: methionine biosynthesis protein MetW [unclassified Inquilinus]|uniref:methionine biosynthesis protein MetW n=1 Tax=unclassified Inquilinus TaxID=2645927 RepID=UPI003F8FF4EC